MLKRVFLFSFLLFFSFLANSEPVTGPIKPEVILPFHPELNAVGTRYRVPVVVGGVTGVAEIGADLTVGRLLSGAARGALGPWGLAAITAAQLCYEQTDWKICHSTVEPILPLQIDTSQITAATGITSENYIYYLQGVYGYSFSDVCKKLGGVLDSNGSCIGRGFEYSSAIKYPCSGQHSNTSLYSQYCSNGDSTTNYSCSSGTLTNSSGAPMAVTGQYCTPDSAYSCQTNYLRSDSYGDLSSGMFCSYQAPALTPVEQKNILAPYLLSYYANQLFANPDGSPNPDYFADGDTTFDPAVTPSDMPVTWDQLKQYVDWVRNGVAQTTDPLASHYISPNNYNYTKNYINTSNSTTSNLTNNTNSATTTITPEQAASSAAMTQAQFEQSTSKADKTAADGINAADTSSLDTAAKGGDSANEALDNMAKGIDPNLPIIAAPDFPQYSSCRTIDMSWNGYTAVFPIASQCIKMEEFKTNLGYFLYLLTAVGLIFELLRRVD